MASCSSEGAMTSCPPPHGTAHPHAQAGSRTPLHSSPLRGTGCSGEGVAPTRTALADVTVPLATGGGLGTASLAFAVLAGALCQVPALTGTLIQHLKAVPALGLSLETTDPNSES